MLISKATDTESAKPTKKLKVNKSEFDEAFDSLAAFLFEQFKKKKLVEENQDSED